MSGGVEMEVGYGSNNYGYCSGLNKNVSPGKLPDSYYHNVI